MERTKSKKLQKLRDKVSQNKDEIRRLYTEGCSIHRLTLKFEVGAKRRFLIEEVLTGLELRGLAGNGGVIQQELVKSTSLKKFGVENASSSPLIKEKRRQTFNDRYGVDNPFQHEEFKGKMRKTWTKNYGVPYSSASPNCQAALKTKRSRPHRILEDALAEHGISFISEVEVKGLKDGKHYQPRVDIFLDDKIALEVYGDYFHANPKKYKPSDKIKKFAGYMLASEIWDLDESRISFIKNQGIKVIVIWEYEIKSNLTAVIERIKNETRTNSKN
jgi:G:T-mismatch repair DNA endonuclease (very short patch repair protein)